MSSVSTHAQATEVDILVRTFLEISVDDACCLWSLGITLGKNTNSSRVKVTIKIIKVS